MIRQNAALYMRLSKDDGRSDESDSITSQRLLLTQYAQQNGMSVAGEFIDDGISGTNWARSGLQDLLQTIEDGAVNTVLVKDLSRLSRDYIRTGDLLENWFPQHGVRLIAVNDGVDTANASSVNDFSPIRAVMDDWYARDISRKVRAALYARQAAGICTAATLPYGYERVRGAICLHADHAKHVKEVFRLYLLHRNLRAAAEYLNRSGIPSPRHASCGWSTATIQRMLKNRAYCGELHLHVTRKQSYKSAFRQTLPPAEHICLQIPRLIPEAEFDLVQQIMSANGHKKHRAHWLSGKATCGCCGSRMIVSEGRLLCGGRKRGSGCRNGSVGLGILIPQMTDAISADGFPACEALLPFLVRRVLVSEAQITVFVRYQKPESALIGDRAFRSH